MSTTSRKTVSLPVFSHQCSADVNLDIQLLLGGRRLRQADARKGRNGVDTGRDVCVIGRVSGAVDEVAANDAALVGGDRRQLRGRPQRIATDVDRRVRRRAQVLVRRIPRGLTTFQIQTTGSSRRFQKQPEQFC